MKNDAIHRSIGRMNALQFVTGLLLDAMPQVQRQLAQIDLGKLQALQLAQAQSDATNAGFVEVIAELQTRHPSQH